MASIGRLHATAPRFKEKDLIITNSMEQLIYSKHSKKSANSIAWGQRKLLLSEIQMLCLYFDDGTVEKPIILYIGAADGRHIPILCDLFPSIEIHCWDSRQFHEQVVKSEHVKSGRIKLFERYFTAGDVTTYLPMSNRIFLVSDIRSKAHSSVYRDRLDGNHYENITANASLFTQLSDRFNDDSISNIAKLLKMSEEDATNVVRILKDASIESERGIWEVDMKLQQEWVIALNPLHALLKFRLPYPEHGTPEVCRYLSGTLYMQAWQKVSSTEVRLHPSRDAHGNYFKGDYSSRGHERTMHYHNVMVRGVQPYKHPLELTDEDIDPPELLSDFDSQLEFAILTMLFKRYGETATTDRVVALSRYITSVLDPPKTISLLRNAKRRRT